MKVHVGVDVAKHDHWVVAIDDHGKQLLSRLVTNQPGDLDRLAKELEELSGERTVGIDVIGGIASLLTAVLLTTGERLVHVPGLSVNRARDGMRGGENKSDPRDARVIADQLRIRSDLRSVSLQDGELVGLRLAVSRRRELVVEQTRRLARLHELLCSVHPGIEAGLDLTTRSGLLLIERFVAPGEIRATGAEAIRVALVEQGVRRHVADRLAEAAVEAAEAQTLTVPGEDYLAAMCKELAADALRAWTRIRDLEREVRDFVERHELGPIIRSMPGFGAVLTGELIAHVGDFERFANDDSLAMASGLAPVLRQSGTMHFRRRAYRGDKTLKRIFYQAAFASLQTPISGAFYERKRAEGKRHHQAVIALARRRITVLHAMIRRRQPFDPDYRAEERLCA